MKRMLCLTVLVLLALGMASQLQAQYYIRCPFCEMDTATFAVYYHYECPYPHDPWEVRAVSDQGNGLPPPVKVNCIHCGAPGIVAIEVYCRPCDNTPFWP